MIKQELFINFNCKKHAVVYNPLKRSFALILSGIYAVNNNLTHKRYHNIINPNIKHS